MAAHSKHHKARAESHMHHAEHRPEHHEIHHEPHAHQEHARHTRQVQPFVAILLLLLITIGASLSAFIWLSKVKVQVEANPLTGAVAIKGVNYDLNSHDLLIDLYNGKKDAVPISTRGSLAEQTIVSLYNPEDETIGCSFIPLSDLNCDSASGICDGQIDSKGRAQISLRGNRQQCKIGTSEDKAYELRIDFGLRAMTSSSFVVK